jgi:hypothetical protein
MVFPADNPLQPEGPPHHELRRGGGIEANPTRRGPGHLLPSPRPPLRVKSSGAVVVHVVIGGVVRARASHQRQRHDEQQDKSQRCCKAIIHPVYAGWPSPRGSPTPPLRGVHWCLIWVKPTPCPDPCVVAVGRRFTRFPSSVVGGKNVCRRRISCRLAVPAMPDHECAPGPATDLTRRSGRATPRGRF